MKKVLAIINSCSSCPHCVWDRNLELPEDEDMDLRCDQTGKWLVDTSSIPSWCPLEDMKENEN